MKEVDDSLEALQEAFELGWYDVAHANNDPDLDNLRAQRPKEYAALTEVKWAWRINYGVFNDDIILTNNSAFALTDVELQVNIQNGQQQWAPKCEIEYLPPGATYTWENIVSVPNNSNTKTTATLVCDQTR